MEKLIYLTFQYNSYVDLKKRNPHIDYLGDFHSTKRTLYELAHLLAIGHNLSITKKNLAVCISSYVWM